MAEKRYPLILASGAMASELYLGDDQIWPADEFSDFTKLRHLKDSELKVGDVIRMARPIPKIGLGKIDLWKSFIEDFLVGELGYVEGEDLFAFPYDWRQDIRISAGQLGEFVRDCSKTVREKRKIGQNERVKFYLLGHSMGTLVCRWYVDQTGGQRYVARMMLLGPTDRGTPSSFASLVEGDLTTQLRSRPLVNFVLDRVLPTLLGGMTDILRSIESVYQTLPGSPFVYGPGGPIDIFEDTSWLEGGSADERKEWQSSLERAKFVQGAMARPPAVPTTYVYGLGQETPEKVYVEPTEKGVYDWANASVDFGQGDGVILSRSAWPGDLQSGVEVAWVKVGHNALHHTDDVHLLLQDQTLIPQSLEAVAGPIGLSPEEIKEYLQAIVESDYYVTASEYKRGQHVVALPANPSRPLEDVEAVVASTQPGKPVVIVGRKGAGKSTALFSVMWRVARDGLKPEGKLSFPIYASLRRYRGDDSLLNLLWANIAETGTRTFLTEQVEALLDSVPCLIFFDDLDRLIERHPNKGVKALTEFMKAYPKVRTVFGIESGSYEDQFPEARVYMLLSFELEEATEALPQHVGDVIVAVIGDNASNIAIGRESSAKSVEVAARAITNHQTDSGRPPDVNYRQLSELVEAARSQEWDKVESIATIMAEELGQKAN
jgi:hypothetical protein